MKIFLVVVGVLRESYGLSTNTPANDLLLRAARGEKGVDKVPVWLFRQAGRHMPEYRAYKEKTGKHFLQLLEDPYDVAEVTMQPLRRYEVDAAILFSDILVVPQAVGVQVDMPGGKGIIVPEPIRDPRKAKYAASLARHDPEWLVARELRHVTRAVSEIRSAQLKEDRDTTLLGFSAAPWTLLFYTVGASSRDAEPALSFLKEFPEASRDLLDAYGSLVQAYCCAQVEAGAHAIQIFEAMGASLNAQDFEEWAMPFLLDLGHALKKKFPNLPLLVFARGVADPHGVNAKLAQVYDVISIDTQADPEQVRSNLGSDICLQGNLDPALLVPSDDLDPTAATQSLQSHVNQMLTSFNAPSSPLIANLGEGLGGKEDPALVSAFVDAVHDFSASS